MITQRTKLQLIVFVLITLVGVAYVGARYARLDRLVFDDSYRVVAHFADSGGIFEGAEVSYRGVSVGQVGDMVLTEDGVDVLLDIDDDSEKIPLDTKALVGNRSAVGSSTSSSSPTPTPARTSARTPRSPWTRPRRRSRPRSCSSTSTRW